MIRIQKFQASTLAPGRVVISAAGIENHDEFVDLVVEKLKTIPKKKKKKIKKPELETAALLD